MDQIYIFKDGQQHGPYSVEDLNRLLESRQIEGDDHFWYEGTDSWKPLREFPGLNLPRSVAPPPPAKTLPTAPSQKKNGGCFRLLLICGGSVVGLVILAAIVGKSSHSHPSGPEAQPSGIAVASVSLPSEQQAFVDLLARYSAKYKAAGNELQKSALRTARSKDLSTLLSSREFSGWRGTLKKLETTSDGKAAVVVQMAGGKATLKTWNNTLSDIGANTLIPQDSPLYQSLSVLSSGRAVVISGEFISSEKDYVREASVTEAGSMGDPEFIVRFNAVQ